MNNHSLTKAVFAEVIGTFWLVFGGCGSAVLAAGIPQLGIGFVGVSLAFGLTVLTMAYAFGHVSGAHFNPAVTLGLVAAKRFNGKYALPYIIAQVTGGILAAAVLAWVASGKAGFSIAHNGLAANGVGALSPQGYSMASGFVIEVLLSAVFIWVILGSTHAKAPAGFAPIAIGLALTLIHLISIPVTNTSVNPARSTGPALMVGGETLGQLWIFWLAPIIGTVVGGLIYHALFAHDES